MHQSNQSYDLHYDIQHGRGPPTVPLQLVLSTKNRNERATMRTTSRLLHFAATVPPSSSSKQNHAREVAHPQCTLCPVAYMGACEASRRMDRWSVGCGRMYVSLHPSTLTTTINNNRHQKKLPPLSAVAQQHRQATPACEVAHPRCTRSYCTCSCKCRGLRCIIEDR